LILENLLNNLLNAALQKLFLYTEMQLIITAEGVMFGNLFSNCL